MDWLLPRQLFYDYFKRLVGAGLEHRIMFGSDEMIWPEALPQAINAVEQAPFLTPAQTRAILCDNAARFLRLRGDITGMVLLAKPFVQQLCH